MEPDQHSETPLEENKTSLWNTVTPFSKYLAMTLFVILPFIGGWIGYTFVPEKIVEIETPVQVTDIQDDNSEVDTPLSQFDLRDRSRYINIEKYDLYSIVAYQDEVSGEFVLKSTVLGKHPENAEIVFRSTAPLLVGHFVKTDSYLIFSVGIESVLYSGPESTVANSSFANVPRWYIAPLGRNGWPEFERKRQVQLESFSIETKNDFERLLYTFVTEADDWQLDKAKENDVLLIRRNVCTACGDPTVDQIMFVDLDSLFNSRVETEIFTINEEQLGFVEWLDDNNFRYKSFPLENRELKPDCQDHPIACLKPIDWESINWQQGSI